jgi:hypothetical protein
MDAKAVSATNRDGLVCPACLNPRASARFDKRGRPYVTCEASGSRLFARDATGMRGASLLNALVMHLCGRPLNLEALWGLQAALDAERSVLPVLVSFGNEARSWAARPAPTPASLAPEEAPRP